jgi:glycosyltransferase involved in cell wall biosynthesis
MSNLPEVSVVMGVYNGERELSATLDSVFSQQGVEFECIVVDDGSTDATWSILEQRSTQEPRLRILRLQRGGLTTALIAACAMAKGEFIARQDNGDLSLPERLARQRDLLASNREVAFVASRFQAVGPGGEILNEPQPVDRGAEIIASLKTAPIAGMKGPHHGSVMFRRSAYQKVGGYRSEFYFAQDLDLWSRLIEVGDLAFTEQVYYQVNFAPGSISGRYRAQQITLRELIREATLLRQVGKAEDKVLQQAAQVRPIPGNSYRLVDAGAQYFIGSCLYARGDPAAAAYLRRAIVGNPTHVRAWVKLLACRVRSHTAA